MPAQEQQVWDLWIPDVGATGISFARGRLDATNVIIVHAAPEKLNVEVRDHQGNVLAQERICPAQPILLWPVYTGKGTRLQEKISGLLKLTMAHL